MAVVGRWLVGAVGCHFYLTLCYEVVAVVGAVGSPHSVGRRTPSGAGGSATSVGWCHLFFSLPSCWCHLFSFLLSCFPSLPSGRWCHLFSSLSSCFLAASVGSVPTYRPYIKLAAAAAARSVSSWFSVQMFQLAICIISWYQQQRRR